MIENTDENRLALASEQVNNWDFEDLWEFAVDRLREDYELDHQLFQNNWKAVIGEVE